jgi:hypothetical protein
MSFLKKDKMTSSTDVTPQAASDVADPTTGYVNSYQVADGGVIGGVIGQNQLRPEHRWSNHRNADQYRVNGRFQNGKLHLTGTREDFLEIGAIITAIVNTAADNNGNVSVQFDGEGQPPIRQAGN